MMTVGDVQRGNPPGRLNQPVAIAAVHAPERVAHAVNRLEIDERLGLDRLRDELIDLRARTVNQKHRAGLRAERQHVPGAIVFLVAPRPFVLLDDVAVVFVERVAGGQAGLFVRAHAQPIQIEARRVFDHERRLPERCEILRRAIVDILGVGIGAGGELDLGARHAQKAEWIVAGQRPRLLGVHHVVWNRGDAGGVGGSGPERTEGTEGRHAGQIMSRRYQTAPSA